MMKIDIETWFGSVSGEADTALGKIIIMLLLVVLILSVRQIVSRAVSAIKNVDPKSIFSVRNWER